MIEQVFNSGYKIVKAKAGNSGAYGQGKAEKKVIHRHSTRHAQKQEAQNKQKEVEDAEAAEEVPEDAAPKEVEVTKDSMTGREAFFALVGIKMMSLSQKYNRKLEELHGLFYTVSCDWKQLELLLQADENAPEQTSNLQWGVLEDLAVRDDLESEAFKHVVDQRGHSEVMKRRSFLEVEN